MNFIAKGLLAATVFLVGCQAGASNAGSCRSLAERLSIANRSSGNASASSRASTSRKEEDAARQLQTCIATDESKNDAAAATLQMAIYLQAAAEHAVGSGNPSRAKALIRKALAAYRNVDQAELDDSDALRLRILLPEAEDDSKGRWHRLM